MTAVHRIAPSLRHCILLAGLAASPLAHATLGIFEHGNGIKSMGLGGISYATADETTTLSVNPAHAATLGNRYDIGIDVFSPLADARYVDNLAGPNPAGRYRTDAKRYFAVPQGGYSRALNERWSLGISMFSAGLGPDYPVSPYQRFGGARRTSLGLGSSGIATALAYKITPDHALGFSLNLGYQTLSIQGLEFLTGTEPATQISVSPAHTTNQGKDGSFNGGFSVGYYGQITPQLGIGIGYRSKSWTQKHKEYRGLLPEGGLLELPAVWGAGLAFKPIPTWTLAFDFQRYQNEDEKAFANPISQLNQGNLFGSKDGPAFGFANMDTYKFGLAWQATPKLVLRAGYIHASQMVQASDTLFGFLGCTVLADHYTAGMTYTAGGWEYSGFVSHAPFDEVKGRNSIPPAFGGGEAIIGNEVYAAGFSLGRRF